MTESTFDLRKILENPADDLPRLVYADWLDEHGEPDRAEFIRVQCEIGPDPLVNARVKALRERERELLGVIPAYRFGGDGLLPLEQFAAGPAVLFVPHPLPGGDVRTGNFLFECIFRRGFVEQVTGPADAFLRHAAVLFAVHPVTEVRLTNREPYYNAAGSRPWICATNCWLWMCTTNPQQTTRYGPAVLPRAVFDLLDGDIESANRSHWRTYPTPDAALSALSAACVSYGRRLAGLSPLIPVQPGEAVG